MAPFTGSTDKCTTCDKTVHFIEMVSADGVPYHKNCFRCAQCNGLLSISTYSQLEGTLYCKPHFEQLCKEKGFSNIAHTPGKNRPAGLTRAPSKLSHLFSGTQDKCSICSKTAYPLEKLSVEGQIYHKLCFRCSHGGCPINPSSYAALDGILYCKPHFAQLFKEKGCYNHLTKTASLKRSVSTPARSNISTEEPSEVVELKPTSEED